MTTDSEIAFIETQLASGHEPEITRAFNLLQQAVDFDLQTQARLAQRLSKYLAEDNKTSHIVAPLHCLYIFNDAQPFKTAVLNLGKSKLGFARRLPLPVSIRRSLVPVVVSWLFGALSVVVVTPEPSSWPCVERPASAQLAAVPFVVRNFPEFPVCEGSASTVPHEVVVPLVVRYLPELPL